MWNSKVPIPFFVLGLRHPQWRIWEPSIDPPAGQDPPSTGRDSKLNIKAVPPGREEGKELPFSLSRFRGGWGRARKERVSVVSVPRTRVFESMKRRYLLALLKRSLRCGKELRRRICILPPSTESAAASVHVSRSEHNGPRAGNGVLTRHEFIRDCTRLVRFWSRVFFCFAEMTMARDEGVVDGSEEESRRAVAQ